MWYPNVEQADTQEERAQLEKRYDRAKRSANCKDKLKEFEDAVKNSVAVINMDGLLLLQLLNKENSLYASYAKQARADLRTLAVPEDDKTRRTVESKLYGSVSEEIKYAALSLDGLGPKSYGPFAVTLNTAMVEERASLLEENSYTFMDTHDIKVMGPVPEGYRSNWENRYKLAVAKLAHCIKDDTPRPEFAKIILKSTNDRHTDEYIEVHIYGSISRGTFEAVTGSSKVFGKSRKELFFKSVTLEIKDMLKTVKIPWKEEG